MITWIFSHCGYDFFYEVFDCGTHALYLDEYGESYLGEFDTMKELKTYIQQWLIDKGVSK